MRRLKGLPMPLIAVREISMRFLSGSTTPEIRSIGMESGELTLALLMFRIFSADDAADDFASTGTPEYQAAIFADRFHGGADFHTFGLGFGIGVGAIGVEGAPGKPVRGVSGCKR